MVGRVKFQVMLIVLRMGGELGRVPFFFKKRHRSTIFRPLNISCRTRISPQDLAFLHSETDVSSRLFFKKDKFDTQPRTDTVRLNHRLSEREFFGILNDISPRIYPGPHAIMRHSVGSPNLFFLNLVSLHCLNIKAGRFISTYTI